MPPPSIDPLLARARDGDRAALAEVLHRHEAGLLRLVELRLDGALRRRLEPRDVVQDALLEAVRRFEEWRSTPGYPFRIWLRLICAQSLAAAQRHHFGVQGRDLARERNLARRPGVDATSAAEWFAASQTSPSQAATREEARELVLQALDDLEEIDREVLVLREFEDLTNEEAAAELGIEPAAASKRFTRALQRLRPALRALEQG